jgi:hypothetical protein
VRARKPVDVAEWFAVRDFRIELTETDYSSMERIRPLEPGEEEPGRFSVELVTGHFTLPSFASGATAEQALARARQRYMAEREGRRSPGTLRWAEAVLSFGAGADAWVPEVELLNDTEEPVELSGGRAARGVLRHPDGAVVTSRQTQPWPMAASMSIYRLAPGQSVLIRVALSLFGDEIAALTPGVYQLTGVTWGELRAPDVDVDIQSDDGA